MTGASRESLRPRQLPLELGHSPALSRDDLIVSDANRAAVALVDRWPDWPSHVTVLAGPTGSGKSHIASIWREMAGAAELRAQHLGEEAIAAATSGPVLIDDVDSSPLDETGLFHLINAVRQADTCLLLCARQFPGGWQIGLPDLASRLKAAATVEIGEPDDALLSGVITKLFADRQIEVDPHVIQFVARRIERSLSAAILAVSEMDRVALERRSRITRTVAADVVAAMEHLEP
ncbi:MAG: DnaA regulatory inactivator HdaA [Rhizobiaceae bacterium]|nr:DnaA regulatory inactivator HdaA [Rhizobiaceae bacterium]